MGVIDFDNNNTGYRNQKRKMDEFNQKKSVENLKTISKQFYSKNNAKISQDNSQKKRRTSSDLNHNRNFDTEKMQNEFESFGHNSCLNEF